MVSFSVREARDLVAAEVHAELQHLGFLPPKAGKMRYQHVEAKLMQIYLCIDADRVHGAPRMRAVFEVRHKIFRQFYIELASRRSATFRKSNAPSLIYVDLDQLLFWNTWDEEARCRESLGYMYINNQGDIDRVATRFLELFVRFGKTFVEQAATEQGMLDFLLSNDVNISWYNLACAVLVRQCEGEAAACRWLQSEAASKGSVNDKDIIAFLSEKFGCDETG